MIALALLFFPLGARPEQLGLTK